MKITGIIIFGLFLALMILVGVLSSKHQKNTSDFWVGSRGFGKFVLAIAIVASIMHGGTLVGGVGMMAAKGPTVLNNISFAIGFLIVLVFMADKLRRFGGYTLPDYMGARYESIKFQAFSAIVVMVAAIATLIAQTKTMGIVVEQMTGIPFAVALVASTLIFVFYTAVGGMRAAIWTDIIQWLFMMVGVIALAIAIWKPLGGMSGMVTKVEGVAPGWSSLTGLGWTPMAFISWHVVWLIAYFTRIEFVTKMYTAKDVKTARSSVALGLPLLLIFINFTVLFAGAARVLVWNDVASPDKALTTLIANYMDPFWASVSLAGIAAAAMSTVSSLLLMSGAAIAHDLIRKSYHEPRGITMSEDYYLKISRITVCAVGLIALIGAFNTPTLVLVLVSYAVALTGASFAMPMLLGLMWKRVSSSAAFASSIAGFLGSGFWALAAEMGYAWTKVMHPIIPGFILSFVTIFVITVFTKPVSEETLARFFAKNPKNLQTAANPNVEV